jgi:UDP-N-acetylmuramate dehydrogenase
MIIRENEPLSKHTSYKTGGLARVYIEPYTTEELLEAFKIIDKDNFFILGRGSNVLFSDDFYDGTILSLRKLNLYSFISGKKLFAGAGCKLDSIVEFSISNDLGGIEELSGIPGSVGGAVFMNAGAFDVEMKDVVEYIIVVDYYGNLQRLDNKDIKFSYRCSGLGNKIVAEVVLHLNKGADEAKRDAILGKRADRQPLDYPSCGSVFKRPKGGFAGSLIEQCGLKGFRIGGAEISRKHANFIVNTGNATSTDIYSIICHVKEVVYQNTGILLEEEVKLVNFK